MILYPSCRNRPGHPNNAHCNKGVTLSKIINDGHGMMPIDGLRFKCSIYDDYNFWENCEENLGIGREPSYIFFKEETI